jgi:hypothetical protein
MNTALQPKIEQAACPECGIALQGRYCHICGERRPDPDDLQLKHFLHHAFHELTHLDSKIFRTLKALIIQPGFLTTEYLAGRKHRYFLPFRLFLVIFALNLFLYTRPGIALYDIGFVAKNDKQGLLQNKLKHAAEKRQLSLEELSERINMHWEKDISTLQFGDVFFFAGLAALVFHDRRRYFVEHLIFSLHTLSFVFLFGIALWAYYAFSGIKATFLIPALSFIVYLLYLWQATARMYGAAKSEALMKSLLLVAGLMAIRVFFITVTLLLALFQTLAWK